MGEDGAGGAVGTTYEVSVVGPEPRIRREGEHWTVLPNEFAPYLFRHGRLRQAGWGHCYGGTISRRALLRAVEEFERDGGYWGKGDYWIRAFREEVRRWRKRP